MIKLLIGGSPCTKWSIAQSKDRETKAEGIGWELFRNYVIAKEKFQPDFYLYENNWSASQEIKEQIQKELGNRLMRINSALVSAQNRDRFYVFNWGVEQPQDRKIFLKDILESGESIREEKSYCLTATYCKGGPLQHTLEKKGRTQIAQPLKVADYPNQYGTQTNCQSRRIYSTEGKAATLCASSSGGNSDTSSPCTGLYAIPEAGRFVGRRVNILGHREDNNYNIPCLQRLELNKNPHKTNCLTTVTKDNVVVEPVSIAWRGRRGRSQFEPRTDDKANTVTAKGHQGRLVAEQALFQRPRGKNNGGVKEGKAPTLTANARQEQNLFVLQEGSEGKKIYEVKDGYIEIQGKRYATKLKNGYYIICKLTPTECERLQTLPDGYTEHGAVKWAENIAQKYKKAIEKGKARHNQTTNQIIFRMADTNRYRAIGNGWTAEIIIHILKEALGGVPKNEKIVVLSMYDGIGTGRYCLERLGFTNIEYHAYEIEDSAIQIAMANFPDIIQHGDAFQIRKDDWNIGNIT